jgi:hypothetical protein
MHMLPVVRSCCQMISACLLQVADIARLSDAASVWKLRAKYAAIRPTGWRSNSDHRVPWR